MSQTEERLLRERDEYQNQVHALAERCNQMTAAATSVAASMVTALERMQELQAVVDAAVEWRETEGPLARRRVIDAIDHHLARVGARS